MMRSLVAWIIGVLFTITTITTTTTTTFLTHAMSLHTTTNRLIGKLNPSQTVLLVCDIQERFRSLIWNMETVIHTTQYMTRFAHLMDIPIIVTEQYSKAFGPTIHECFLDPPNPNNTTSAEEVSSTTTPSSSSSLSSPRKIFEKKQFSMITPQVQDYIQQQYPERNTFLLVGIEAHVCVQQTCLDLLSMEKDVHIIADAVSSQQRYDRDIAVQRMQQSGAFVTTAQSAAFMCLQSADHPKFKAFNQLTMEHLQKKPSNHNPFFHSTS